MEAHQQPHCQPIQYCTYWPLLDSFNNWNILKLSHKATFSEEIDKIHQVLLYVISEDMDALVQTDIYGVINKTDTTTMG